MSDVNSLSQLLNPRQLAPACGCFGSDHECPAPVRDAPIDPRLFELCYAESYLITARSALNPPARG